MMVTVSQALKERISVRAFIDRPVPELLLREVLATARWAPSGGNLQPWGVVAVTGAERDAVVRLAAAHRKDDPEDQLDGDTAYPPNLWEPYRSRRFKLGEDMYAAMGIAREDRAARLAHLARNFDFFDAPVGLFFTIDRSMGRVQWAHLGMFILAVALAAQERGLATCAQGVWARFRRTLKQHFELPETEIIYCGMALGYADPQAPVNSLRSDRAEVDEFAQFRGFGDG